MAGINSFNNSQITHQNMIRDQIAKSGQNSAAHTVSQGSTGVSKQQTDKHKTHTKEESHLSEAAQKAMEQAELKEAANKGGSEQAGKAAGKAKTKEREKSKGAGDGDVKAGGGHQYPAHLEPGDTHPTSDGGVIVVGDKAAGIGDQKLTPKQKQKLDFLDSHENARRQTDDIPAQTKPAILKMADDKVNTKDKRKKHADLKLGGNDFNNQVEGVITKTTAQSDPVRGKVGAAGIRSPKHQKPMMVQDTQAEEIAKEAAAMSLADGSSDAHEAFVA